jgi:methyl coenzyme M reductase subunit C-like uncharacterized protein (methanogenesis marker protein 7)
MIIEGKKNLEFAKKAYLSHLTYLSYKAIHASDKELAEKLDPEIVETNNMLDAIEKNLERYTEEETPLPISNTLSKGRENVMFFR